ERLRFDVSHPDKITPGQIKQIENIVNEQIKADLPVRWEEMSVAEAKAIGATGVFEHKYGEKVKVYFIGGSSSASPQSPAGDWGAIFSKEICGGPHVTHTGELGGQFKIIKEESSSAGVRRIKAVLQ
ncbi:MAG: alanine--tRNA ligase, partial [Patescibacteria group bacterium]